jgi:hypothetical protein
MAQRPSLIHQIPALGHLAPSGGASAKLVPLTTDGATDTTQTTVPIALAQGTTTIGRANDNLLVLNNARVSRYHSTITVDAKGVFLADLGSGNGTFLNGERIGQPEALSPGDQIHISPVLGFRLVMDREMYEVSDPAFLTADDMRAPEWERPAPPKLHTKRGVAVSAPVFSDADFEQQQSTYAEGVNDIPLDEVPTGAPSVEELEQQRSILAVLYQVSLRCLLAKDGPEVTKLLTNVVHRLVTVRSGIMLIKVDDDWRINFFGDDHLHLETAKNIGRALLGQITAPEIFGAELMQHYEPRFRSGLFVPVQHDEINLGLLCCFAETDGAYDQESLSVIVELAKIAAAALSKYG